MKRTFFWLIIGCVLVVSLTSIGCKPKAIKDPDFFGDSTTTFSIIGYMQPSSVYIPPDRTPSQVQVVAQIFCSNRNVSLANRQVVFQQFNTDGIDGISWGVFENNQVSIKKVTNITGNVGAFYYIPKKILSSGEKTIYIRATLIDTDGTESISTDIPLKLLID